MVRSANVIYILFFYSNWTSYFIGVYEAIYFSCYLNSTD